MSVLRLEILEQAGLSVAAMSGVSDGDCASRPEAEASRNAFLAKCRIDPARLARARQVHGTAIHVVDEDYLRAFPENAPATWPASDGLITNIPGIALGVSVADCVPLWIFDPARSALGVFHAGREGTVSAIASIGVKALTDQYGSRSEDLLAVIGPSAGPCCYEVSEEMARDLASLGFPVFGRKLDLWESNRQQLEEAGVPTGQIFITRQCTLCGDGFHSYRKSGSAKRNLAVGMLGGNPASAGEREGN